MIGSIKGLTQDDIKRLEQEINANSDTSVQGINFLTATPGNVPAQGYYDINGQLVRSDGTNYIGTVLAADVSGNVYANIVGRTDTMQNLTAILGTAGELATANDEGSLIRLSGTAGVYDRFESVEEIRKHASMPASLRATQVPEVQFSSTFGIGWADAGIGKCFFIAKPASASNAWKYSEDGKHWRNADPMSTVVYASTTAWAYTTDGDYVFANPCAAVAGSSYYEIAAPYGAAQQVAVTLPASQLWKLTSLRSFNSSNTRSILAMPTAAAATTAAIINNGTATTLTLPISAAAWVGQTVGLSKQPFSAITQPIDVYTDGLQVIYIQAGGVAFNNLPNLPVTLVGPKVFLTKGYIFIYSIATAKYFVSKITLTPGAQAGAPNAINFGTWTDITANMFAAFSVYGVTAMNSSHSWCNSRHFATLFSYGILFTSDFINWQCIPLSTLGSSTVASMFMTELGAAVKCFNESNRIRFVNLDTGATTTLADVDGVDISASAPNAFRLSGNTLIVGATTTSNVLAIDVNGGVIAKPAQFNTSTAATGPISIPKNTETFSYNPATTTAAITINLPPVPFNGQEVTIIGGGTITTGAAVTTLTLGVDASIAGTTIIGAAATTLVVGTPLKYKYDIRINAWYRLA
jgi:hypothetical protein